MPSVFPSEGKTSHRSNDVSGASEATTRTAEEMEEAEDETRTRQQTLVQLFLFDFLVTMEGMTRAFEILMTGKGE